MNRSKSFTVTAVDNAYAAEILYCNTDNLPGSIPDVVGRLSIHVAALPAAAGIDVDLLKPGGSPGVAADWLLAVVTLSAVGLGTLIELANWRGVRLRAQSGATAGTATVHASWHKMGQQ